MNESDLAQVRQSEQTGDVETQGVITNITHMSNYMVVSQIYVFIPQ